MANGDFKDLNRRIIADKVLRDKSLNIAKSPKYDGYQRGLASEVQKFFDTRIFKKRNLHSPFIHNISDADLADMQLISKLNKDSDFYYVLLIFISNMHGLFL